MLAETTAEIEIAGQHLKLLPVKALFWVEQNWLIVADVHLGKTGHFRKAGIAVPKLLEQEDLARLSDIITEFQPETVVFLGDFFHSELNNDWQWLLLWRELFQSVRMILVQGNHDILSSEHYINARFEVAGQLKCGPFLFTHEPLQEPGETNSYVISGHIHPAVKLKGKARQAVVLPCFYFGEKQAVLPAFGKFTGTFQLRVNNEDWYFAVLKNKVIKIE